MAWSTSNVFAKTLLDGLNGTAFSLGSDSFKGALFNNSITPDRTVATAVLTEYNGSGSQWLTANEVYQGAGTWPQGGESLSGVSYTQTTNVDTWIASNTASGAATTLASVYGVLCYDSTQASRGICYNYFGGANSVTSGVFTIVWNASGIATIST
jgi:hypothetical protein